MSIPDIYVSTVYILVTLVVSELTRIAYNRLLAANSLPLNCSLEFIESFELCAVCYELGLICDNYGPWVYAVYLFLTTIWWNYRWTIPACPYVLVEFWIGGQIDTISALAQLVAEIAGGSIFYRFYLQYLWSLEYGDVHKGRAYQEKCNSDIQVSVWLAAVIEGAAVFACRLISRMVSQMDPKLSNLINSFVGTALVVAALTTSGGYFNPVLASALQYGCDGATMWEHLSVYWVGDTIGAILVVLIWRG